MVQWLQTGTFLFVILFLILSVLYSIRYRRQTDANLKTMYQARMNICMGLMLIGISITQLFFLSDSVTRRTFGTICFLLGVFNLFAGIRNHRKVTG